MAFPTVAGTSTSIVTPAGTSHSVTLPASIAAGNLIIIMFGVFSGTVTTPSGWTSLSARTNWYKILYRIADGSEGASLTVATSGSTVSTHLVYRITDHAGTAPAVGVDVTATNQNPNPPSLTPSWGAADTLWIALNTADTVSTDTGPTNYAIGAIKTNTGGSTVGMVARQLNAASEDPGTFALFSIAEWVANTVAVCPTRVPRSNPYPQLLAH